ncbi:hypothetical protein E3N88_08038 [Mikania micrantha]|uniref:Uncharacterized protein n=1 Tax=Mikania micrantha TaxID=192012 RepID=A0A5N6PH73_9ASTR|nr:hypothetical protein E3N88_08038 [Mikania micrantha]
MMATQIARVDYGSNCSLMSRHVTLIARVGLIGGELDTKGEREEEDTRDDEKKEKKDLGLRQADEGWRQPDELLPLQLYTKVLSLLKSGSSVINLDVSQKISCKSRTVDGRQRTSFNSAGVEASNYSADPVNKKIEMMPRQTVGVDYGSNCSLMSRQAGKFEFLAADICLGDTDHMWGNCEVCCDINSLSRDLTRHVTLIAL